MGAFPGNQGDESLLAAQGNPYRAATLRLPGIGALAPYLPAMAAMVLAFAAFSAASAGFADPGVQVHDGVVTAVSPTGFAWAAGVRGGQPVLATYDPDVPGGRDLTIAGAAGSGPIVVSQELQDRILRNSIALAVLAIVLGGLAIAARPASPAIASLSAMVALPLAAVPLGIQGDPIMSSLALGGALLIPAGWAITRLRGSLAHLLGLATLVGGLGFWLVARLAGADVYPALEGLRSTAGLLIALAAFVVLLLVPAWRRGSMTISAFRPLDLLAFAVLTGGSVVLLNVVHLPGIAVAVLLVAVLVVYPATRQRAGAGADRLVLAGVRETAALQATERERMRMASELHDSSMQELAGVIRRLERLPDAAPERDALRDVAAHLRDIATGIRPPMLDDLGLVPALGYLAQHAERPNLVVAVDLDDSTGVLAAERLAPDVELELYRICEEAVNNAVAHARASRIEIGGRVSRAGVLLRIQDDGVGATDAAMEAARRAGRLGLVSIRRRATLIGADVRISNVDGTRVEVRWPR